MTFRCGVLGSPIAHSLSPVLHTTAYAALGLSGWEYTASEVTEATLADHLAGLDETWRGLSLTMPLKRAVLGLLDSVSPVAEAAGAVNTVLLRDAVRTGENTDVPGAVAAVRERYDGEVGRAVVVGGGATAASMVLALTDLGAHAVRVLVREPARAEAALAVAADRGLAVEVADLHAVDEPLSADLVVSTIPGTAQTPALVAALAAVPVVFEVVYAGWPTPLAASALDAPGRVLVSGLDLLVHQAVLQVALMTDLTPATARAALPAMRAAGEAALATR